MAIAKGKGNPGTSRGSEKVSRGSGKVSRSAGKISRTGSLTILTQLVDAKHQPCEAAPITVSCSGSLSSQGS